MGSRGHLRTGAVVLVVVALCSTFSVESFRYHHLLRGCGRTTHDPEYENSQQLHGENLGEGITHPLHVHDHPDREDGTRALEYHSDHLDHHDGAFKGFRLHHPRQVDKNMGSEHQFHALKKTDQPDGMSKFGWLHHFDLPEGVRENEMHSDSDGVDCGRSFYHQSSMRRFSHQEGARRFYHHDGGREFFVHDGVRFHRHHSVEHRGLLGMLFSKVRRYVRAARAFVYVWRNGGSMDWRELHDQRFDDVSHSFARHHRFGHRFGGDANELHYHHEFHDLAHQDQMAHTNHLGHHDGGFYKDQQDHFCRFHGYMGRHERKSSAWWKPHDYSGMRKFGWLHHSDMPEHARDRDLHERFNRHDGERRFYHQDSAKMHYHQDSAKMHYHQDSAKMLYHRDAMRKAHMHNWMRHWKSNAEMRESHGHHGTEHRGYVKSLFSKVIWYFRTAQKMFSAWRHGEPLDFSHHGMEKSFKAHSWRKESFKATPWPEQFTVNFTTKSGDASGFLAYDWVHKRQIIYHGPDSTFCSSLGTEDDCQMMEVTSGTYIYVPSQSKCSKIVDNVGSVPPEWTTYSEYVGTDLVPGVGECRGFAFPPTEHVYYETVDGGLPCVFVFPDPSMTYYFLPETFKLGAPDEKLFDFPENCVTVSREIILRKRTPKKFLPDAA